MAALVGIKQQLEELEQKLLSGTPLSDPEQSFYDSVSSNALEEKQNAIKDFMHHQVDDGLITSREKTQLLSQVNERLETIQKELTDAEKDNKPKKVEKLTTMKVKAEARKVKLTNITPKQPHRLKREAEIIKFRKELQPLLEMEDEAKGRLLSIKETKSLARKEEILEEIIQLEVRTCAWNITSLLRLLHYAIPQSNQSILSCHRRTVEDGLKTMKTFYCALRHAMRRGLSKVSRRRKRQKQLQRQVPPGKRLLQCLDPSRRLPGENQSLPQRKRLVGEVGCSVL